MDAELLAVHEESNLCGEVQLKRISPAEAYHALVSEAKG